MFRSLGTTPAGVGPIDIATADVNHDGHLDLLVTNSADNNVSVLLGDGHGHFGIGAPAQVINAPRGIAVGDLDGNGSPDFVIANSGDASISIGLNFGDGTFTDTRMPVGQQPQFVALGDI